MAELLGFARLLAYNSCTEKEATSPIIHLLMLHDEMQRSLRERQRYHNPSPQPYA